MTHSAVLLALDAIACFRLTRLIVADTVTATLRQRLIGRTYDGQPRYPDGTRIPVAARPKLAEFLGCPWCIGPWCAATILLGQEWLQSVTQWPVAIAALSAVAGILSEHA